jgi:alpha-ketoglutarate-dependent taurine dioxygenase
MGIETSMLSPIGVEVIGAEVERLLHDERMPDVVMDLLEARGVVLFRALGIDDGAFVTFAKRLGDLAVKTTGGNAEHPEIYQVSLDPDGASAIYTKATFNWHIDGATEEIPTKASLLAARVVSDGEGDTQFASTYAAYDRLSAEEKLRFAHVKVVHTVEAAQRLVDPDPDPADLAYVRALPTRIHPLVWTHRSGRKSLVLGATASHIDGMPQDEGAALLADLLDRATQPEHVYSQRWGSGDVVIWDNRGVLHRVLPYPASSGRTMHRVTLAGDEPIE